MTFPRLIAVLMIVLLVGIPAAAQDGYPLPENLPSITPENATQITELARIGGVLPGDLVWSPDGSILAAATSAGVKLYDADDLTAAPRLIPDGSKDVLFNPAGTIVVSGGQIWNVQTGNAIAPIGASDTRAFSPSGNILVTSRFEDGEKRVFLWDARGKPLATLDTDSPFTFWGAEFNVDESLIALRLSAGFSIYKSESDVVQLWNVETGTQIAVLEGTYSDLGRTVFSPNGRYLAVQTSDNGPYGGPTGEIHLWETETGLLIETINEAFETVLSPDGSLLVYERYNNLEGVRLDSLESFSVGWASSNIIFSPDGKMLAAIRYGSETTGDSVILWDVNGGSFSSEPIAMIPGKSFNFSEDGHLLATLENKTYQTYQAHIWNIDQRREIKSFDVSLPDYSAQDIEINLVNERLIVDYGVEKGLWDIETGTLINHVELPYFSLFHSAGMLGVYWKDDEANVINLETGVKTILPVIDHYYGYALALNASQNKAAFSSDRLQVYDLLTSAKDLQIETKPRNLAFSADANHLLLWENVPSNPDAASFTLHNITLPYGSYGDKATLGVTPLNSYSEQVYDTTPEFLAWATWDVNGSTEKLYNLKTGELVACWTMQPNEFIESNTFTPDGKFLIIGSFTTGLAGREGTPTLTVWDVNKIGNPLGCPTAKPQSTLLLNTSAGEILDLVFSVDGEQLALSMDFPEYGDGVNHNYVVYLLPTADLLTPGANLTQETIDHMPLQGVYQPQFSPDGKLLLTATNSDIYTPTDTFDLWNVESGEVVTTFGGDGAAAFSGDGSLLVTHGENGISLWEVASLVDNPSPQPLIVLADGEYPAVELAFSPDNSRLYGRWSGGVLVYGVASIN